MELKTIATVFVTVFLAELGDKTQIATMLFASDQARSRLAVFIGASLGLLVATALGVMAGSLISGAVSEKQIRIIAGLGFIAVGCWTLFRG